jgi:hypothetical protein
VTYGNKGRCVQRGGTQTGGQCRPGWVYSQRLYKCVPGFAGGGTDSQDSGRRQCGYGKVWNGRRCVPFGGRDGGGTYGGGTYGGGTYGGGRDGGTYGGGPGGGINIYIGGGKKKRGGDDYGRGGRDGGGKRDGGQGQRYPGQGGGGQRQW